MYNYQAPGQFSRPPQYGAAFSGAPGQAPGMGPPPSMVPAPGVSAPGVTPPPSVQQAQQQQQQQPPQRPGALPQNFNPPANMPNINFNAPVIRLGTTGAGTSEGPRGPDSRQRGMDGMGGAPRRAGLGLGSDFGRGENQRGPMRESVALAPPTREEIARTLFIGNIKGTVSDENLEQILRAVGRLRRFTRAHDADAKPCSFGFAEYEDVKSLEIAVEIFRDGISLPKKGSEADDVKLEENGEMNGVVNGESNKESSKDKLMVVVDQNSLNYIDEWASRNQTNDPMEKENSLSNAKNALEFALSELNESTRPDVPAPATVDVEGDTTMQEAEARDGQASAEVVMIPLSVEDELADIPADMRETVAAEIAAFRERSNQRDIERLRKEEEMENLDRARSGSRVSRLASPPPSAPVGPAGGANGIPLGPGKRGVEGAPSGPKGYQSVQIPKDYQRGVAFVNGGAMNGASPFSKEEEESDASDSELERRRKQRKQAKLDKAFSEHERKLIRKQGHTEKSWKRQEADDTSKAAKRATEKELEIERLKNFNDDVEATRRTDEYYADRSAWIRNRAIKRGREAERDAEDRNAELREKESKRYARESAHGMADSFLDRQADELAARDTPREPQRFKMQLNAAAPRQNTSSRRTAAEVEGLLEDEEEAGAQKRTLIPIKFDTAAEAASLTDEERAQAVRQLASEIPTDKEGLWNWEIKWDYVEFAGQVKEFVEKKIVDYLGVQEQMLVDVVEEHMRKRDPPQQLVGNLEGALDEEAEELVKKLWRMLIFFSESEKRGLSS